MQNVDEPAFGATPPPYPLSRDPGRPLDPPSLLRDALESGGVCPVRLFDGASAFLVTRFDDQRKVLADRRISVERTHPGYPVLNPRDRHLFSQVDPSVWRNFVNIDDPEHHTLRRMLTAEFTLRNVEKKRPSLQQLVDGLIDEMLAKGGPVDLMEAFALPVPTHTICELLGVPYADREIFQRCTTVIVDYSATPDQLAAANAEFISYISALIDAKEKDPGDDLLSRLVVEQLRTGHCSVSDLILTAKLLLFAGHDTTANMIALGTLALLQHPDQLEILRETDAPEIVAGAVEELLRYLSIVQFGRGRVALDDLMVGGTEVPAGTGVIMVDSIGNRDPRAFAEPDRLDIRRDARHHLAFGFGVHQCLGQHLARVELQVAYGTLYRRIPTLRLAVPFEEIRFKSDSGIYGVHELPVTW